MINEIVAQAPIFLLIMARTLAMIMTLPLFSMRTVSSIAKIALAGYMSYFLLPQVDFSAYQAILQSTTAFNFQYIFLLIGEALIGIITGFFISIIFSAFSTAGQFFAFQMGFSASEVYDSLSQVENPLMGQYLNLIAMLVFLQNHWFQELFLGGLVSSFKSLTAISIVANQKFLVSFLTGALTKLFSSALVIALPLMGVLLLITICTGVLSKAAPQMNLLSEGFPVMILVSFFVITSLLPSFVDFFTSSFQSGLKALEDLFLHMGKQI